MQNRVLIVGGGIAGPALALMLDAVGISSAICEAHPQIDDIGGGMQVAPNGMQVLVKLGIAEQLLAQGVPNDEFSLENQRGTVLGRVANGRASKYGVPAVWLPRRVLHKTLINEAERRGIVVSYGKRLTQLESNGNEVLAHFEDGSAIKSSLLIGADGIHSRTRDIIFPNGPRPTYTGLFTVGGFAAHPTLAPSSEIAMRRGHLIFGRNGFFGYGYFDRENPTSVMWWSHTERTPEPSKKECLSWSTEALREELLDRHRHWHEPVGTILRSTKDLLKGPVYDLSSLPNWSNDRVLLIGDAAHATSPHSGQGASLALEDAMYLAKLFRDTSLGHEQIFERFMQARRNRVEQIVAEARRRGDGKRILSPSAALIRDAMLFIYARFCGDRMNDRSYSHTIAWDS